MPGNCPAQFSPCGSPVENIPFQGERHSGERQKVFAFPPEWVFTFRTECCSESQRNGVRLRPDSAGNNRICKVWGKNGRRVASGHNNQNVFRVVEFLRCTGRWKR